jgi:hypothetical protein
MRVEPERHQNTDSSGRPNWRPCNGPRQCIDWNEHAKTETGESPRRSRADGGSGLRQCAPGWITADRMDYGQVVADSWKRQTLLNVIRLRYADVPVFLDVASIIKRHLRRPGFGCRCRTIWDQSPIWRPPRTG